MGRPDGCMDGSYVCVMHTFTTASPGGWPVQLFPHSPLEHKVCPRQEECGRKAMTTTSTTPTPHLTPPLPSIRPSRPHPQTSTDRTHQVISWGLKYLLGKYLAQLTDPTSQFKDAGLTNVSLYLTNHEDVLGPHPADVPGMLHI